MTSRKPRIHVRLPAGGTLLKLGNELSADLFELLATRVANLQASAVAGSLEPNREAEARFDLGAERAELRGLTARTDAPRSVRANPVLGLANRQATTEHDLEPMFLRRVRLESEQRA